MVKSVLITGCSSGIGLALAHGLRARGWRVFATARKAEDVVRLTDAGFPAVRLDLADSASIANAVEEVLAQTGGRLDALCNNGAYGQPGAVEDLRREVLREQFETNLFGTVELTNRVIPVMRRQGHGRIVQVSSLLGYVALPYRGAYTASKYALEGITDTLRLELAESGIHVVLIEPGPIESRFRANAFSAYQRNIDKTHSVHRQRYETMERRLTKPGPAVPFTLPAQAVLAAVRRALEARRPRTRYRVTLPATLFWYARRWLPDRWLDALLLRVAEGETK
ncbi:SDR family NAD(P)-dependent oxidoreductase [Thiobacter aerophilum]|uniref:SDR family NAD(P)-dependent oxidoreductase n=1 Tax=Thiobacter aerophilum TaxID=3121275 RepID=A0ABV0EBF9_9BURK